jgi:hypothetical protein
MITVNVYHQRDDLRQIVRDRPELFELMRYERTAQTIRMVARGEKKDDSWDDWDELFAALSEAESSVRDEYEVAYFNTLKTFCDVYNQYFENFL